MVQVFLSLHCIYCTTHFSVRRTYNMDGQVLCDVWFR